MNASRPDRSKLAGPAFVGAVAVALTWLGFKEFQPDSYRLLYTGRWIAGYGIPHHDAFTIAASGRPFADQQWLAELTHYEIWRVAGYAGVALMSAGVFALGYALLAALMRRRGVSPAVSVACATFAVLGSLSLTFVRAQNLVIALFVGVLWLCLEPPGTERPRRRLLAVPALLVLWANLHGSVVIGVGVAALYLLIRSLVRLHGHDRSAAARYFALAALAALAPLATPYGLHVVTYYSSMFGNSAVALADIEWDAPALGTLAFLQLLLPLMLAGTSTLIAWRRGQRPPLVLAIAVALTAVADLNAMRNGIWLAIAAAMLTAETSRAWVPTRPLTPAFTRALAVGAVALGSLVLGSLLIRRADGYETHTPLNAIAATAVYGAVHPCARIMADTRSASALLWLYPELAGRVGFDGELEVYAQRSLREWIDFQSARGPQWLAAARGYQILVGSSADQPRLVRRLSALGGTSKLATDRSGIAVLERSSQCVSG